jgi:hypothetical protein
MSVDLKAAEAKAKDVLAIPGAEHILARAVLELLEERAEVRRRLEDAIADARSPDLLVGVARGSLVYEQVYQRIHELEAIATGLIPGLEAQAEAKEGE